MILQVEAERPNSSIGIGPIAEDTTIELSNPWSFRWPGLVEDA